MAAHTLFGTTGIRGDAKELFTNQFSFDLGRTFAIFLKNEGQVGKIAVGIDPRESSPRIRAALVFKASCQIRESPQILEIALVFVPEERTQ